MRDKERKVDGTVLYCVYVCVLVVQLLVSDRVHAVELL